MTLWIILAVYVVGFIGFLIAMSVEAPKYGARIQPLHFGVAAIWPLWAVWYAYILISEQVRRIRWRRK